MTDTTLIQRLQSAAHWHLTEGNGDDATHQALQDAAAALEQQAANLAYVKAASVFNLMEENKRQAAQIEALRADAERLRAVADAASVYYEHYMQDEAESPEYCVCGDEQHQRAVEVRDSLAALRQEQPTKGEGA